MALITFYKMNGCGHCVAAEKMIKDADLMSKFEILDASQAPKGKFRGFPAWVNKSNPSKTHTGRPKDLKSLFEVLEIEPARMPSFMPSVMPNQENWVMSKGSYRGSKGYTAPQTREGYNHSMFGVGNPVSLRYPGVF